MYREHPNGIERLADGAVIPADMRNNDYFHYLEWQAAGNIIAPYAPDLNSEKMRSIRALNNAAEAVRMRYLTPGAGMALTYQEKFAQANAVYSLGEQAANAMSEADRLQQFPILARSVGIERETLYACAVLVLDRYQQFNEVAGVIEANRLTGIAAIKAATTVQGVQAAHEAIAWPTP